MWMDEVRSYALTLSIKIRTGTFTLANSKCHQLVICKILQNNTAIWFLQKEALTSFGVISIVDKDIRTI